MNERILMLRKSLGLSRAAFGEKLGVSGDVINNLERGRVSPKDYIIKLICSTFHVREEWLLDGIEPMYIEPDSFSLDDYVKARGAEKLELEIVKAYFDLDPEIRKAAVSQFRARLASAVAADPALLIPETAEELERQYPPIDNTGGEDIG